MNCTICLDKIKYKEMDTSCSHQFHQKCLEKWLINSKKKTCPLCRQRISFERIGVRTRSRTEHTRRKKLLNDIIELVVLWEKTTNQEEKVDILTNILKIVCNNHYILKKHDRFWDWLKKFKNSSFHEDNDRYRRIIHYWRIKFESR